MKIAIPEFAGDTTCSINTAYLNFVASAGLEPILFSQFNDIENIALVCDGLLLPGGIDLEPTFYGEDNVGSNSCNPEKDDFERQVLHAFVAQGKKVFGICRGFQLIVREFLQEFEVMCNNLVFYQHVNNHSLAADRGAKRSTPTHSVVANVAALYGNNLGKDAKLFVNSMHHQALVGNKKSLNVVVNAENSLTGVAITKFGAPSTPAGLYIIEAVDVVLAGAKLRGIQWHPEELMDAALLITFFGEENNGEHNNKAGGIKI